MLVSVKDACILQEDALDIRVTGRIEQLDDFVRMEV
jgi:hypothetical protein